MSPHRSGPEVRRSTGRPCVVHLTTVDLSLAVLLLPQLRAFREAGYDVVGVSAAGPHVAMLEDHSIQHVPLRRATRAANLAADLAAAREFLTVCRRLRPDIVHTHNPKPGVYGRIAARLARVPVVVNTVHGLYAQPTDRFAKRAVVYSLERLAATCSDAELIQNPEDLPVLRRLGIPARRLHLLGNGIDLSRFDPARHAEARAGGRAELGVTDEDVVIGAVGRLVHEKGYAQLFEAAARLRTTHPQARFVVIGPHDPDKSDALTDDEIAQARTEGGVVFLGMRDDVERLYPAMDVYVLASHREGFPRSAMEAAAMGLPIVATDIRGCRQVVEHDRTGLLVPARDHVSLTAAIGSLVDDADRRRRFGDAARQKALGEFDDRRQIAITLGLYEELLARRARAR